MKIQFHTIFDNNVWELALDAYGAFVCHLENGQVVTRKQAEGQRFFRLFASKHILGIEFYNESVPGTASGKNYNSGTYSLSNVTEFNFSTLKFSLEKNEGAEINYIICVDFSNSNSNSNYLKPTGKYKCEEPTRSIPLPNPVSAPKYISELHIGESLEEKYLVKAIIARGGMGIVYLVDDENLNIPLALKVLQRNNIAYMNWGYERFKKEAMIGASIYDTNVVHVIGLYDAKYDADSLITFLVMEYVDGKSLESLLKKYKKIPEEIALLIVRDIAHALVAIESKQIIHRDVTPSNIMFSSSGYVKLADFGIARVGEALGVTKCPIGKPPYMAPEAFYDWDAMDIRGDIYSLGIAFFEMVTGQRPYNVTEQSAYQDCNKEFTNGHPIVTANKIAPELTDWTVDLIAKMLEKNVTRRFQHPQELLDCLKNGPYDLEATQLNVRKTYNNPREVLKKIAYLNAKEGVFADVEELPKYFLLKKTQHNSWVRQVFLVIVICLLLGIGTAFFLFWWSIPSTMQFVQGEQEMKVQFCDKNGIAVTKGVVSADGKLILTLKKGKYSLHIIDNCENEQTVDFMAFRTLHEILLSKYVKRCAFIVRGVPEKAEWHLCDRNDNIISLDKDGKVPFGRYFLKVECEGYESFSKSVVLNKEEMSESVELKLLKCILSFTANVGSSISVRNASKQEIFVEQIESEEAAKCKWIATVPRREEQYTAEVKLIGYKDSTCEFSVKKDKQEIVFIQQIDVSSNLSLLEYNLSLLLKCLKNRGEHASAEFDNQYDKFIKIYKKTKNASNCSKEQQAQLDSFYNQALDYKNDFATILDCKSKLEEARRLYKDFQKMLISSEGMSQVDKLHDTLKSKVDGINSIVEKKIKTQNLKELYKEELKTLNALVELKYEKLHSLHKQILGAKERYEELVNKRKKDFAPYEEGNGEAIARWVDELEKLILPLLEISDKDIKLLDNASRQSLAVCQNEARALTGELKQLQQAQGDHDALRKELAKLLADFDNGKKSLDRGDGDWMKLLEAFGQQEIGAKDFIGKLNGRDITAPQKEQAQMNAACNALKLDAEGLLKKIQAAKQDCLEGLKADGQQRLQNNCKLQIDKMQEDCGKLLENIHNCPLTSTNTDYESLLQQWKKNLCDNIIPMADLPRQNLDILPPEYNQKYNENVTAAHSLLVELEQLRQQLKQFYEYCEKLNRQQETFAQVRQGLDAVENDWQGILRKFQELEMNVTKNINALALSTSSMQNFVALRQEQNTLRGKYGDLTQKAEKLQKEIRTSAQICQTRMDEAAKALENARTQRDGCMRQLASMERNCQKLLDNIQREFNVQDKDCGQKIVQWLKILDNEVAPNADFTRKCEGCMNKEQYAKLTQHTERTNALRTELEMLCGNLLDYQRCQEELLQLQKSWNGEEQKRLGDRAADYDEIIAKFMDLKQRTGQFQKNSEIKLKTLQICNILKDEQKKLNDACTALAQKTLELLKSINDSEKKCEEGIRAQEKKKAEEEEQKIGNIKNGIKALCEELGKTFEPASKNCAVSVVQCYGKLEEIKCAAEKLAQQYDPKKETLGQEITQALDEAKASLKELGELRKFLGEYYDAVAKVKKYGEDFAQEKGSFDMPDKDWQKAQAALQAQAEKAAAILKELRLQEKKDIRGNIWGGEYDKLKVAFAQVAKLAQTLCVDIEAAAKIAGEKRTEGNIRRKEAQMRAEVQKRKYDLSKMNDKNEFCMLWLDENTFNLYADKIIADIDELPELYRQNNQLYENKISEIDARTEVLGLLRNKNIRHLYDIKDMYNVHTLLSKSPSSIEGVCTLFKNCGIMLAKPGNDEFYALLIGVLRKEMTAFSGAIEKEERLYGKTYFAKKTQEAFKKIKLAYEELMDKMEKRQ